MKELEDSINKEIDNKDKNYILNVNEEEYKSYLMDKYLLQKLSIDKSTEYSKHLRTVKEKRESEIRRDLYEVDVHYILVSYSYSGSKKIFDWLGSKWAKKEYNFTVNESSKTSSLTLKTHNQNKEQFNTDKQNAFSHCFNGIDTINSNVDRWNSSLIQTINGKFNEVKNKFLREDDFFRSINVSVNPNTKTVFNAPVIKKISIPQVHTNQAGKTTYTPTLENAIYLDIIKVLYEFGKSLEKKQTLYKGKDEETLRDLLLIILETRYVNITASGEAFNKSGKTDILLKHSEDNSNVFIAECKFWKGQVSFNNAINQLFDKYLTWRDSKVALIFFVDNQNFTQVLKSAKEEAVKHEYYSSSNGEKGESSFSYIYHFPNDVERKIYLEIILFHFC